MVDYKLALKASDEVTKSGLVQKKPASITSLKRQPPSKVMAQKLCSDDEAMPFTLMSYQQEIHKSNRSDKTQEAGSFASSGSSTPSVVESMYKQNKIEEKFKRVANPFKSQFEPRKQLTQNTKSNIPRAGPSNIF